MGPLSDFVAGTLGLTKLPPHLPTLSLSALGFLLVHQVLAPWGSRKWFPEAYQGKSARTRNSWCIRVVSQVHTAIIVPLSLWVLYNESPGRVENRAFGWSEETGFVHAIACGYFLWDTFDAIYNYTDLGFLAHAISCLAIYTMTYRPFLAYYATRCLLWETSTLFLNAHWFFDKTGRTGSTAQLINAFFLLGTFFGVRIVYGGMVSWQFFETLLEVRQEIPVIYVIVYGGGNLLLTGLNWLWFYRMIDAMRRRFSNTKSSKEQTQLMHGKSSAGIIGGNNPRNGYATGYGTHP